MDEYDLLLYEINREKKKKEERKFWEGKEWTEEQIKKLSAQNEPPLQLNKIKSGQEIQREQMREQMGLSDTRGLVLTEENMKKLFLELTEAKPWSFGTVLANGVIYDNFSLFSSYLINKYFTKE